MGDLSFLDDLDIEFRHPFAVFLKVSIDFGRSLDLSGIQRFGKLRSAHFGMLRGGLDLVINSLLMVK